MIQTIDITLPHGWHGRAYLEDMGSGKGRLTIHVDDNAFTCYWGAMGEPLRDFLVGAGTPYLLGKLWRGPVDVEVVDCEALARQLRAEVVWRRRHWDISKDAARRHWNEIDDVLNCETMTICQIFALEFEAADELLGDEWWRGVPMRPKHNHLQGNLVAAIDQLKEKLRDTNKLQDMLDTARCLGQLIIEQDNRATDAPLFAVIQKRRIYHVEIDEADGRVWVDDEGDVIDDEVAIKSLDRRFDAGDDTAGCTPVGYKDIDEFVTGCFTEAGCRAYIERNGHNLNEPSIYAFGSFRNTEFRVVRELLIALAKEGGK